MCVLYILLSELFHVSVYVYIPFPDLYCVCVLLCSFVCVYCIYTFFQISSFCRGSCLDCLMCKQRVINSVGKQDDNGMPSGGKMYTRCVMYMHVESKHEASIIVICAMLVV